MSQIVALLLASSALLPQLLTCPLGHLGLYVAFAGCVTIAVLVKRGADFRLLGLLWGFALPLIPWLGAEVVETLSLLVLFALVLLAPQVRWFVWAGPFVLYVAGAVLYETAVSVIGDNAYFRQVRLDEISRAHDAIRGFFSVQAPSFLYLSHTLLFVGCIDAFSAIPSFSAGWKKGFLTAAVVSSLYAIAQWSGISPVTLSNQTALWTSIGRVSGLMTDPNALGLVMTTSLWMLLSYGEGVARKPLKTLLVASALMMGGVVSGSRTFWIGLIALAAMFAYMKASRLLWRVTLGAVALVVLVTVIDLYTPLITSLRESEGVPQGIKRIISSMSLARFDETIASRKIFFALALSIITRDPLFGVGPNAFAAYVPLVGAGIPSLRGWSDNSNNFYLGIISELGILGLCAFCIVVASRRFKLLDGVPFGRGSVIAVALMLITGPHTDFVEVLVPFAFLIGIATTPWRAQGYAVAYVGMVFLVSGAVAASHHERGAYGWHRDGNVIRRWLSPASAIEVSCSPHDSMWPDRLVVKPAYVPTREPLRVLLRSKDYNKEIVLSHQHETTLSLPCGRYSVSVSPAWSPARAWPEGSHDRRLLGVEQIASQPADATSPNF